MAEKINLLPQDIGVNPKLKKSLYLVRRITLYFIGVVFMISLAAISYLIFLGTQTVSVNNRIEQTKASIRALESTEQKLFLVKDRIQKSENILKQKDAYQIAANIKLFLNDLPSEVFLEEMDIDSGSGRVSIVSRTSLGMAAFLNSFAKNFESVKAVKLTNFSFLQNVGYKITLEVF